MIVVKCLKELKRQYSSLRAITMKWQWLKHSCECYCHLNLEHMVLFDPYSFAVKTVPRVDSLFPGILVPVVKYKI